MGKVQALSKSDVHSKGPGLHHDGGGLYLQVTASRRQSTDSANAHARSWLFRFKRNGRERWMGLGSADLVPITDARRRAHDARRLLLDGIDPIEHRDAAKTAQRIDEARARTFEACAEEYFRSGKLSWQGEKYRAQYKATLRRYAYPQLGSLPLSAIDTTHVMQVLSPIWSVRTETAGRVRQGVEDILDWGIAHGYRDGENPARWRGQLDKLLPARTKVRPVQNRPALPYPHLPDFIMQLRARVGAKQSFTAAALEFLILTAARTGEVLQSTVDEFDLDGRAWIVPASRMKTRREHRVPLSGGATQIVESLISMRGHVVGKSPRYVFSAVPTGDQCLDPGALLELLQSMRTGITVHGFRSTFRVWASEQTSYPREVQEAALAHAIRDKAEAAYARSDLFVKRRALMDDWAAFCASK